MKRLTLIATLLLCACAGAPTPTSAPTLAPRPVASDGGLSQAAAQLDLQKFMGHWYVIANITSGDEAADVAVQLDYQLKPDGRIDQRYTSRRGDFISPLKSSSTEARVAENTNNAHWKVRSRWALGDDYLILYVDPEYRYAVAGTPKRDRAWILGREARMTDERFQSMQLVLEARGYEIPRLLKVPQIEDQDGSPGYR